ncbi:hypothetical protein RHSIM_Rhsim10G0176700 [Rhododendron simsii]|uniref:Uncharacterized protein n=1 Tax=Rhododendron simsii TaxID=118357 RepID=A0A834LE58_RHOSS|nr:hypothetical protein RHSIM_Rhsim10G0176700 [Rhododendron simsii]
MHPKISELLEVMKTLKKLGSDFLWKKLQKKRTPQAPHDYTCIALCKSVPGHESMTVPIAYAVKMINTMSVIHHDQSSMDNADLRRGLLSTHKHLDQKDLLGGKVVDLCSEGKSVDIKGVGLHSYQQDRKAVGGFDCVLGNYGRREF